MNAPLYCTIQSAHSLLRMKVAIACLIYLQYKDKNNPHTMKWDITLNCNDLLTTDIEWECHFGGALLILGLTSVLS